MSGLKSPVLHSKCPLQQKQNTPYFLGLLPRPPSCTPCRLEGPPSGKTSAGREQRSRAFPIVAAWYNCGGLLSSVPSGEMQVNAPVGTQSPCLVHVSKMQVCWAFSLRPQAHSLPSCPVTCQVISYLWAGLIYPLVSSWVWASAKNGSWEGREDRVSPPLLSLSLCNPHASPRGRTTPAWPWEHVCPSTPREGARFPPCFSAPPSLAQTLPTALVLKSSDCATCLLPGLERSDVNIPNPSPKGVGKKRQKEAQKYFK